MNYSQIIKRAWKIVWQFKILWIFGILASCSASRGGSGGGGGNSYRSSSNFGNNFNSNINQLPPQLRQWAMQIQHMANTGELLNWIIIIIIILALLAIVVSLISLALGTIGQIGLINGTWKAEEGAQKLSFGEIYNAGKESFWKVILFKILLAVAGFVVAIAFILLAVVTLGCGLILLLPVLVVGSFALWVLVELILVAMVGDKMAIMDAISNTWTLFKKNWVGSSLMGLLLAVIDFVASLIFAIPMILAVLPAIFGTIAMAANKGDFQALVPSLIISGVLMLLYLPFAIFLHGVLQAYLGTAWALTYRQLTDRPVADQPHEVQPPLVDLPSAT